MEFPTSIACIDILDPWQNFGQKDEQREEDA
jgi:hypothetical protein